MRNRLEETLHLAHEELKRNQSRYKFYTDRKRKEKYLKAGMKVLVLLLTDNNKLLMQLKGPYVIKEKINKFDYRIDVNGKERVYHANLLRRYNERGMESCDNALDAGITAGLAEFAEQVCVSVIEETDLYEEDHSETNIKEDMPTNSIDSYIEGKISPDISLPRLQPTETVEDVQINPELIPEKKEQLRSLVRKFSDVLTDLPGRTSITEHEIKLMTIEPVRSKSYPVPHAMKDTITSEIDSILKQGFIVPIE